MPRNQITKQEIKKGVADFHKALLKALDKKGYGAFASSHEVYGILDEEYEELKREFHSDNKSKQADELLDVAISALFGYICIKTKKLGVK